MTQCTPPGMPPCTPECQCWAAPPSRSGAPGGGGLGGINFANLRAGFSINIDVWGAGWRASSDSVFFGEACTSSRHASWFARLRFAKFIPSTVWSLCHEADFGRIIVSVATFRKVARCAAGGLGRGRGGRVGVEGKGGMGGTVVSQ